MTRIARPKLEVRDLEIVLAVAAAGSTVRAAASLHVTQSAISRGLMAAEDKLGVRLFERNARGLTPTEAGERLIAGAGPVLHQLSELEAASRAVTRVERLRLVCECYTAYRWLPSTLSALEKRTRRLQLTLAFEHTTSPLTALLAGDVDIALLTTSRARRPLLEAPLFEDEIVFVVGSDHPLAGRSRLEVGDLCAHPLIISTNTPKPAGDWFRAKVLGPRRDRLRFLAFPLTEAVIDAARAGLGIAVLSEWIAGPYLDSGGVVAKRWKGHALKRSWRMAYRREVAAAASELATVLRSAAPHPASRATAHQPQGAR